jgi:hypothetical protein
VVVFQINEIYSKDDPTKILKVKGYLIKSSDDSNMELQRILKKLDNDGVPGQITHLSVYDQIDICKKVGIQFIVSMTKSDDPKTKLNQFMDSLTEIIEITGNIPQIRLSD